MSKIGQYWDKIKQPFAHTGSSLIGILSGGISGVMMTGSISNSNMANRWLETSTYAISSASDMAQNSLALENILSSMGAFSGLLGGSVTCLLVADAFGKKFLRDAFKRATYWSVGIVSATALLGAAATINNFKAYQHQGWCIENRGPGESLESCLSKTPEPLTLGFSD